VSGEKKVCTKIKIREARKNEPPTRVRLGWPQADVLRNASRRIEAAENVRLRPTQQHDKVSRYLLNITMMHNIEGLSTLVENLIAYVNTSNE